MGCHNGMLIFQWLSLRHLGGRCHKGCHKVLAVVGVGNTMVRQQNTTPFEPVEQAINDAPEGWVRVRKQATVAARLDLADDGRGRQVATAPACSR